MRIYSWLTVITLTIALPGCKESNEEIANGDDPLRALTVPFKSARYTSTYWTRKKIQEKDLYAQALAYCKDRNDGEHPNCDVVRYVDMIDRMSTMPEDRPNDFSLRPGQRGRARGPNQQ
jgi:hypothetical protein